MTDFTSGLVGWRTSEVKENSPGTQFANGIKAEETAAADKRIDGKFQSAYESSGIDSTVVSPDAYDFKEAFVAGSTLKKGDMGVKLPNKHIKERGVEIAGRDFRSGVQYRNNFSDTNGNIDAGLKILRNNSIDTMTGSPWEDVNGLNRIALGMSEEGATYEDFMAELENTPWINKPEQASVAWFSSELARESLNDVETGGARFIEAADEEVDFDYNNIPLDMTEDGLPASSEWTSAGRAIIEFNTGESTEGLSDEEISQRTLDTMGLFFNNLPEMMLMANTAIKSENPEYAQAFLTAMHMYEATDMNNWNEFGRFLKGGLSDLTNYAGFGAGVATTRLAGGAVRAGIKKKLVKVISGLGVDAVVGAGFGAGYSASEQTVEKAAGVRNEISGSEVAKSAAVSGGLTVALGAPINIVADPSLIKFRQSSSSKSWNNLHSRGHVPDFPAGVEVDDFKAVKANLQQYDMLRSEIAKRSGLNFNDKNIHKKLMKNASPSEQKQLTELRDGMMKYYPQTKRDSNGRFTK